ncbi:translation initiation factor eif3a [Malassezia pachydermatis]|uniref:Translation initiation factor eif3a n=1 Tax=Malassezia pachydermatis TaxID=77020 RepID=A0A0M8MJJ4_9BASI|nr:translation initiation factor eif3a [Malassezia pachydermatis]KOS12828.1 translation initiation factor eif3a [Malassezia pachydermatis]
MIWSSATRENVCKMVETVMTSSMQRALLQRVWARETLVTPRDFGRKVSTTKDLSIVWDELNEWDKYLRTRPSPDASMRWSSRASAEGRLFEIRHWARQTISRKEEVPRFSSIADELQAEAEIRRTQPELLHRAPLETHPYGPHNTILVDDSVDKAKCQPDNHICIPDYGEKQAALYKEYRKATNESEQDVNALDDYLLQLVGVLDTMADQSDVSTWIRNGGVRTFSSEQTPEDRALWVERGKKALSRYKIPLIV